MQNLDPDWVASDEEYALLTPEHKMMTMVLYNAVKDALSGDAEKRRTALAWFRGDLPEDSELREFMSFRNLSVELGLSGPTVKKLFSFASSGRNSGVFFRLVDRF